MPKILAISGSLRHVSVNTSLLRAVIQLAPDNLEVNLYSDLPKLAPFNPDLEGQEPLPVLDFRRQLQSADAVIIASPEYAHGVTGVLKNALDWVVGSGEFVEKPVALLNASDRAVHAYESLHEILRMMNANIVRAASVTIPLNGRNLDEVSIVADGSLSSQIRKMLITLSQVVENVYTLNT